MVERRTFGSLRLTFAQSFWQNILPSVSRRSMLSARCGIGLCRTPAGGLSPRFHVPRTAPALFSPWGLPRFLRWSNHKPNPKKGSMTAFRMGVMPVQHMLSFSSSTAFSCRRTYRSYQSQHAQSLPSAQRTLFAHLTICSLCKQQLHDHSPFFCFHL